MIEQTNSSTGQNVSASPNSFIGILRLLWQKKVIIIAITAIITIGAIIISLLLAETYKSSSVLLPETDKSKLASLGGLSDLASIAGLGIGEVSSSKLYPAIMKSETVLRPIIYNKYKTKKFIDSVNLIEYLEITAKTPSLAYEKALLNFRNTLDITTDLKTGIMTVSFETGEPQLTADIVNGVTAGLDKYMRLKRATNATKQRQWIEDRLGEVKQDLATSEDRVKNFKEKNRVISSSPLLLLEQDRLVREVQINAALFAELKKQYELIKIEEIKNSPIINILDTATAAARKENPKRGVIVITWFLISLFGSAGFPILNHSYGTAIKAYIKQIQR